METTKPSTMESGKGLDKAKSSKGTSERKPLIKMKTAPPVRQTLTSYKRMLKANPLLQYQEAGIDIEQLFKSRANSLKVGTNSEMADSKANCTLEGKSSVREFKKPEVKPLMRTQSLKLPKSNGFYMGGDKKTTIISRNQPLTNGNIKKPPINNPINNSRNTVKPEIKPKSDIISKYCSGKRKPPVEFKAKFNSDPKRFNPLPPKPGNIPMIKGDIKPERLPQKSKSSTIRRSLSSDHIQRKKGATFAPKEAYRSDKPHSEDNISVHVTLDAPLGFSPILEENSGRNLIFKTPSASERRSICQFTPRSVRKSALFQASTPAPVEMQKLQERLNKWLKSRGKPLASFYHLRCFGNDQTTKAVSPTRNDEEDKENLEVIEEKSESYENLKIDTTPESSKVELPEKNDIPEEELAKVSKEAMTELQKLIEEDYPRAQCLGWLELIREKYRKAVDEPEYWECRAAIEQSVGNVGNAVEFYKTAIIQGAEVSTVDKSLDQLLKKFSLLNISPNKPEEKRGDKHKERIIREARNVFKSTIIQFAIQERKLKRKNSEEDSATQNSKKLVATPVRRSTRISRSGYVSTPGVKLCTSLKEINLSIEEIDFAKNKALC